MAAGCGGGPVFIILHVNHFLLAVVTVVGLHMTGALYDLEMSMEVVEANNEHKAAMKHYELKHTEKSLDPPLYLSGAIWAVIVGLLGIIALVVLIISFFKMPTCCTNIVKWYYLVAFILILLVASFGLGYNPGVEAYEKCMHPLGSLDIKLFKPKAYSCVINYTVFLYVVFAISILHAMLYLTAFLLVCCDGSGSSSAPPTHPEGQSWQERNPPPPPHLKKLEPAAAAKTPTP